MKNWKNLFYKRILERGDQALYTEVKKCCKEMGK